MDTLIPDYTERITRSFVNKAKEGGYVRMAHNPH
jgi:hypothetical protein